MPSTSTPSPRPRLRLPSEVACTRIAWVAWAILTLVTCISTVNKMVHRPEEPLTNASEEFASRVWWERGDLYRPMDEPYFLYLPHAAVLYTPFGVGPALVKNVVVRVVYAALMALALFVFAGLGDPSQRGRRFLLMTLACIPVTAHSIRAAQANLPLAACMMLGTVMIQRGRWTWATAVFLLGVAFKPLGVVWVLLAAGMWPRRMVGRLAVGLVLLALFPFAFGPPDYVLRQYADFWTKMTVEVEPVRYFSDIRGLLTWGFHVRVPSAGLVAIRMAAALGTLAVALVARRRWNRTGAALALYVLAACYLMLFNPKTEAPTFTLLGPALGVFLAWALLGPRNLPLALAVAVITLLISLSWEIWGPRNYWFQPSLTIAFIAIVLPTVLLPRFSKRGCPWTYGAAETVPAPAQLT